MSMTIQNRGFESCADYNDWEEPQPCPSCGRVDGHEFACPVRANIGETDDGQQLSALERLERGFKEPAPF